MENPCNLTRKLYNSFSCQEINSEAALIDPCNIQITLSVAMSSQNVKLHTVKPETETRKQLKADVNKNMKRVGGGGQSNLKSSSYGV